MSTNKIEYKSEGRFVIGHISNCVDTSCEGWLVDSFSGKYWIKCEDPKHIPSMKDKVGENQVVSHTSPQPICFDSHKEVEMVK